jgi:gas vesicle protein
MSDTNHTGAFFAGFITGGLVGATVALLMTPQSGEQTRLQIRDRGIELKTQLGDLTTDARGQAEKLASQIQERGKVIIEEQLHSGGQAPTDEGTEASADDAA